METIKKYGETSSWAEELAAVLQNTYKKDLQKEAEINVKTLPKVVWRGNTFFVALDTEENSADVLNEYGNVVKTIKNASSVEDVETALNKKIVANNDSKKVTFAEELENIADQLQEPIQKEADFTYSYQPNSTTMNTQTPQNQEMSTTDPSINGSVNNVTNTPSDSSANITNEQMDQATTASINLLKNKYARTKKELKACKKNIAELTLKMNKLAGIVEKLTDDIHAYMDPGNVYDLDVEKIERQHYNDTANQSARAIDIEHSIDLTVPRGRVSLKDKILQDIDNIISPIVEEPDINIEIQNEPEEVTVVQIKEPEENDSNSSDITSEDQYQELELPEENIEDTNIEVDNSEDNSKNDSKDNVEDNVNVDDSNNINIENDSNKDVNIEDSEDIPEEPSKIIDNTQKKQSSLNMKKIASKDVPNFKNQICPACKQKRLVLKERTANLQNILCKSCNSKYAVDLDTEEIFER